MKQKTGLINPLPFNIYTYNLASGHLLFMFLDMESGFMVVSKRKSIIKVDNLILKIQFHI